MRKIRWGDILIFLVIILVACLTMKKSVSKKGDQVVVVTLDGEYQYPLNKNGTYKIPGQIGITTIEVLDGKVRIIDSPCPNKTCVALNWGTTLICLPNSVVVRVDKEQEEFDAIAE